MHLQVQFMACALTFLFHLSYTCELKSVLLLTGCFFFPCDPHKFHCGETRRNKVHSSNLSGGGVRTLKATAPALLKWIASNLLNAVDIPTNPINRHMWIWPETVAIQGHQLQKRASYPADFAILQRVLGGRGAATLGSCLVLCLLGSFIKLLRSNAQILSEELGRQLAESI